jgi:hypothetical protein
MARALGWLMAAELLACGLDFSFAPCVDLDYGLSEIIGDRAFHARASVVATLAVAYMHGMRDAGMAATAKHFPGHGAVVADSHLALPVDRRELVDMDEDLLPYRRLIANGLPAVMVAHVLFPAVDAVPASFSQRWIPRSCARTAVRRPGVRGRSDHGGRGQRRGSADARRSVRWRPDVTYCRFATIGRCPSGCSISSNRASIRPRSCA